MKDTGHTTGLGAGPSDPNPFSDTDEKVSTRIMVKIEVQSRSGKPVASLDIEDQLSVRELKKKIHAVKKALPPARQRLTLPAKAGERPTVLDDAKPMSAYGLTDGSIVQVKDLGPQVGYATVFFWEYFGPLVIYPLFYFLPQLLYPGLPAPPSPRPLVQTLALGYWSLHYAKRILETFFLHRFGHDTMPLFNLVKNCSYYWGFAAFVAYFVNHPLYTAPAQLQSLVCLSLALLCQLGNWRSHVTLANLRKPGEKDYKIPTGGAFNFVTCANYMFEVYGWVLFSVATQALPAALFTLVGMAQMMQWAVQKHKRLIKTFDGKDGRPKYPRRWIMLPPFF